MKNRFIQSIILMATASLVLGSCQKEPQNQAPQPAEAQKFSLTETMLSGLTLATAQAAPVEEELRFFGKITTDQNQYIDVYPLVGGNVLNVYVSLGDYVHKGQALATIRSTELSDVQRDVSDAKNELAVAQNQLRVQKELYDSRLNTSSDVAEAKSRVQRAQDELRRASQISQIYNIKNGNIYTVTAPISGYVVYKNINKDMQLRSDRSDNIFDIANTKNLWALVNVNESDISKISTGMRVQVSTIANPGKSYPGTIDRIIKVINPETNAMQARVNLENTTGELIPESKATITVRNATASSAIAIPAAALIFDDNKNFVVVYRSEKDVEVREVQVLSQTEDTAYISEGLARGERVATGNQLMIYQALSY